MDTVEVLGKAYLDRAIDTQVGRFLTGAGAIIIEGPRGCGKTMTGLHHAKSYEFLDTSQARRVGEIAPETLLEGERPRLLDEWQLVPDVWNLARRAVDSASGPGQFILTGSAVPEDDPIRHSGAGRFLRVRQRTMTWAEKNLELNTVGVSLAQLHQGSSVVGSTQSPSLQDVIACLLQPGFPGMLNMDSDLQAEFMRSYIADIATSDIHRLTTVRAEPEVVKQLILSLARSTASEVSVATLGKDIARVLPQPDSRTIAKLLELLLRVFFVEEVPAWSTALRSKAQLRKSPKYHLADPALAAAALGASAVSLARDPETTGLLFESAVIHDLQVYTEALGGRVVRYRDSNGYEMDAVLLFPDGSWAGIEVKLGFGQVKHAAERLKKVASVINGPDPAFLAVISGTGPTLTLEPGVFTFPLHALRP